LGEGRSLDPRQLRVVCDAFDSAWAALIEAGPPLEQAESLLARERLAKHILDKAEQGIFDLHVLREDALAYMRGQQSGRPP
jgi:hypothetical protein